MPVVEVKSLCKTCHKSMRTPRESRQVSHFGYSRGNKTENYKVECGDNLRDNDKYYPDTSCGSHNQVRQHNIG